jgi:hypothetical protein
MKKNTTNRDEQIETESFLGRAFFRTGKGNGRPVLALRAAGDTGDDRYLRSTQNGPSRGLTTTNTKEQIEQRRSVIEKKRLMLLR